MIQGAAACQLGAIQRAAVLGSALGLCGHVVRPKASAIAGSMTAWLRLPAGHACQLAPGAGKGGEAFS